MTGHRNIYAPIDLFGALITPRFQGEDLASYGRRVLQVLGVITHKDPSEGDWQRARERELAGHTGYDVRLISGARDPDLLDQAEAALFTWDRLDDHDGPFRWPRPGASGEPTYYNAVAPTGSGVAAPADLEPFVDPETQTLHYAAGFVVVEGEVWYVAARPRRMAVVLPPDTTKTALPPIELVSDHPHYFEAVSETEIRVVAEDHEHRLVVGQHGEFVFEDVDGGHTHRMRSVVAEGPVFMAACPDLPELGLNMVVEPGVDEDRTATARTSVIDGLMGIPVLTLSGVEVETGDGAHVGVIDPHDYWTGTFTIGDDSHVHDVVDWVVQEAAGHTHPLDTPTIPEARALIPLFLSADEVAGTNPHVAYLTYEHGHLVVENPHGLGRTFVLVFDTARTGRIPDLVRHRGETIGVGPALPATHAFVDAPERARVGSFMDVGVRTEDRFTGGVPGRVVEIEGEGSYVKGFSDEDAWARLRLRMPQPSSGRAVVFTVTVDGTVAGTFSVGTAA